MSIVRGAVYVLPNNRWQRLLDQTFGDGWARLNSWKAIGSIAAPIVMATIAAIVMPGVIAWGLTHIVNTKFLTYPLLRFIYPAFLLGSIVLLMWVLCIKLLSNWVRMARDDVYLVGKQLHNLD
ncbi:hypothetical protein BDF14DRAFT_958785 [Spinellus fusiger]|nr:hypothetical protein BDF14DRAFT_958785 [Spinellus fusiger]